MVDLDKSPHSEHERKVQRLYVAAKNIEAFWFTGDLDVADDSLNGVDVFSAFDALDAAISAFDGEAFNEVKS